jgi:hypothetical protein
MPSAVITDAASSMRLPAVRLTGFCETVVIVDPVMAILVADMLVPVWNTTNALFRTTL